MQAGNLPLLDKFRDDPNAPKEYLGDHTDLFRSADLIHWEYVKRFYDRRADNSWTDETEDDMCPSFLPLPASPDGGPSSGKYLQLFIAHNKGTQYYIGTYQNDTFYPEIHSHMS